MVAVITQVCIFTYRLLNESNLKSPGSSRPLGGSLLDTPTDGTAVGGAGGGSSGGKGQRKPRVKGGGKDAPSLRPGTVRLLVPCSDAVPKSLTADMDNASLNASPVPMETEALPMDEGSEIAVSSSTVQEQQEKDIEQERNIVKQEFLEVKQEIPVKQEKEESEELERALVVFCQEALGRGIVAFSELRDRPRQAAVEADVSGTGPPSQRVCMGV